MLCDDDFGPEDAPVVCRSLGLTGGARVLPGFHTFHLSGAGPINMSLLACAGGESTVNGCPYFYGNPGCRMDEEVGVECAPPVAGRRSGRVPFGAQKEAGSWLLGPSSCTACEQRCLLALLHLQAPPTVPYAWQRVAPHGAAALNCW